MKKTILEQMGGAYTLGTDGYYYPDLELPAKKEQNIGIRRQRHLRYIKKHPRVLYTELLTSGKLNGYLADINNEAEKMFSRLAKQMASKQGIAETLKAVNQMAWVGRMNNICGSARETVLKDIIHT